MNDNRKLRKLLSWVDRVLLYDSIQHSLQHIFSACIRNKMDWKEFNGAYKFVKLYTENFRRAKKYEYFKNCFTEKESHLFSDWGRGLHIRENHKCYSNPCKLCDELNDLLDKE